MRTLTSTGNTWRRNIDEDRSHGLLAAHAITTIHYLIRKDMGDVKARRIVSAILKVFGVAAVNGVVVQEALQLSLSDFEDAVTAAARLARMRFHRNAGAEGIPRAGARWISGQASYAGSCPAASG
jgi:hypothetical protein